MNPTAPRRSELAEVKGDATFPAVKVDSLLPLELVEFKSGTIFSVVVSVGTVSWGL